MKRIIRLALIGILALVALSLPIRSQERGPDSCKFCGVWEYVQKSYPGDTGHKEYLKITKMGASKFKLTLGFEYQGSISWNDAIDVRGADGIYLKPINGRLIGRFVSSNFQPTHSMEFTYKITCTAQANKKMLYSVWSSIRGETEKWQATRISNN